MNPFSHPGTHGRPILDVEKQREDLDEKTSASVVPLEVKQTLHPGNGAPEQGFEDVYQLPQPGLKSRLVRWNAKIEGLAGFEARGISRVLPEEKHGGSAAGYVQMFALWFGMSLCVINLVLGFLGPQVFQLGWVECVCITIFANALACCGPAYMATFGAPSGHRSMILARYFMGYWPAKLACLLNVLMQVGWGVIGAIIAGQLISAVNGSGLSIAVGCVVAALCIGGLATFGIAVLHVYERYAAYPQLFAILILVGASGRDWNTSLPSIGDAATVTASRCSFFALMFSAIIGFTAISADFYVYYPTNTNRRLTFFATWAGNWASCTFVDLIGIGIATGIATKPAWTEAYTISSGALLKASYEGLGGFGDFCLVILALGCINNIAPSTYVGALSMQTLGKYPKLVPRWVWSLFLMVIELACSVAGRNRLFIIFENFLPIMACWVCPYLAIVLEEDIIFHTVKGKAYDWTIWQDKDQLPLGAAAMTAWLVGWAGAIVGMSQVWYAGPVALELGGYGGDIGGWLSIAFAGMVYPPLRYLELRKLKR
ncbi:Vitamin B6 transporter [Vermiconidia calcicola]|uniref:Vitamin B6 transporter n=1 Tax=Vermiconidia calcicola TaxID=1690605 RepID=A0ACC3MVP6_9PEZI|nr:Vitamin B6 transporter [Vermiconidia calcicola]